MAKKQTKYYTLPMDTALDIIRVHKTTGKTVQKEMMYGEWLSYPKHKDYYYTAYQKGFSQFK